MCQVNVRNEEGKLTKVKEAVDFFQERGEDRDNFRGMICDQCNMAFATHEQGITVIGDSLIHAGCVRKHIAKIKAQAAPA